ncbi:hypothetical protein [Caulobacter sp. S45]|uniref:hypothetical protein n=1 Tax=Caulobacter sp. S45 TaxID=1641861 RepID=UPI001577050F|nr:hypothetical protein [Caulobacter sp. S45]
MLLSALLAFQLFASTPGTLQTSVREVSGWRLKVSHDSFTGQTSCDMRRGAMRLTPQTLVVRLGGHVDSSAAEVRVDQGPAHIFSRYDYRFSPDSDLLLSNPSGGVVELPTSGVSGARVLAIEEPRTHVVRTFDVSGGTTALQAARAAGCWSTAPMSRIAVDQVSDAR